MSWKTLSKPPIREAIIDFKYESKSTKDHFNLIDKFIESQKHNFPIKKERVGIHIAGQIKSGDNNLRTTDELEGYLLNSSDSKKVIIITTKSFSYHIIKPYSNWKAFYDEAKIVWKSFMNIFQEVTFTRIALRYINEIDFKFPLEKSLEKSIYIMPNIPKKLPSSFSHYFLQMGMSDMKKGLKANITQAFKQPKEEKLTFIFDIDVYKNDSFTNEQVLWNDIDQLRDFKNSIFFNSLSTEIIKRYE